MLDTGSREKITPVKPSEAVHLGRLIYPVHIRGAMYNGANGVDVLGAIACVWWKTPNPDPVAFTYTALGRMIEGCPSESKHSFCDMSRPIWAAIVHLNDEHFWSDSSISEWLKGIGL